MDYAGTGYWSLNCAPTKIIISKAYEWVLCEIYNIQTLQIYYISKKQL